MISSIDFDKLGGLVPAIIQDAATRQVLMLGFMNRRALEATLRDGLVTFWSRSRGCLWRKGETSGNQLHFLSLHLDCDRDTLLLLARPTGPACHTGAISCFETEDSAIDAIAGLESTIRARISARDERSYTWSLVNAGRGRIAQKVGEEGLEVALAAVTGTREELMNEAADLLYHLLVLLAERGSSIEEVAWVLKERRGKKRE